MGLINGDIPLVQMGFRSIIIDFMEGMTRDVCSERNAFHPICHSIITKGHFYNIHRQIASY